MHWTAALESNWILAISFFLFFILDSLSLGRNLCKIVKLHLRWLALWARFLSGWCSCSPSRSEPWFFVLVPSLVCFFVELDFCSRNWKRSRKSCCLSNFRWFMCKLECGPTLKAIIDASWTWCADLSLEWTFFESINRVNVREKLECCQFCGRCGRVSRDTIFFVEFVVNFELWERWSYRNYLRIWECAVTADIGLITDLFDIFDINCIFNESKIIQTSNFNQVSSLTHMPSDRCNFSVCGLQTRPQLTRHPNKHSFAQLS